MTDLLSQKVALFDIDYTLFHTENYRKQLYPLFAQKLGVDASDFFHLAKEVEKEMKEKYGHFSPEFFLEKLAIYSEGKFDNETLRKIFWDEKVYITALDSTSRDLFEKLQKHNIQLGIFSTGDREHQRAKIASLTAYLHPDSYHIFNNKVEKMQEVLAIYEQSSMYIIDDLPTVLSLAKEINRDIITIQITGKKGDDTKPTKSQFVPDWCVDSLREAGEIILKER